MTKKRCVNHWGGTTVQPSIEREKRERGTRGTSSILGEMERLGERLGEMIVVDT